MKNLTYLAILLLTAAGCTKQEPEAPEQRKISVQFRCESCSVYYTYSGTSGTVQVNTGADLMITAAVGSTVNVQMRSVSGHYMRMNVNGWELQTDPETVSGELLYGSVVVK